jgi:multisubunit Na+/H+ antiporter MnhG subunit
VRTVITDVLLIGGGLLLLVCALGVLVMRGPYDKLHYASASGWGTLLVALAILVHESFSLIADKALATAALLAACGPALGHATARAARIRERGEWNPSHRGEPAEREK